MKKWVPSWRYVPIDYNQQVGVFEDISQKSLFTNNLNGEKIRIRLNNLYSDVPMRIEHMTVALRNRISGRLSQRIPVTLNGSEQLEIGANSWVYSDEISRQVSWEEDFVVCTYFKERTEIRSVCTTSTAYSWQSVTLKGNFYETEALGFTVKPQLTPVLAMDPYPNQYVVGLCEISVLTGENPVLIGMFGDSITHMSYYSDSLMALLYRRFPGKCALVNAGIGGNRIQKSFPCFKGMPGEGHQFGIAGKDRIRQDLFDGAAPDIVLILEGVNDCSHSIVFGEPEVPEAEDIYVALRDTVFQAQAMGSKVLVSTVTPFGAFGDPWRDRAEEIRCAYNDLIRERHPGDDWIDLDAVMRDPEDPHRMQEGMHLGDGVHPNWAGGEKMARAVAGKWFLPGSGYIR